MSLQHPTGGGRGERPPVPDCPTCQRPMALRLVMPLVSPSGFDEVTYGCEICEAESKRTENRR